jgi:hypothetical protein
MNQTTFNETVRGIAEGNGLQEHLVKIIHGLTKSAEVGVFFNNFKNCY